MSKPKDVDSYIANSVIEAQPILKELHEIILSTFPKAEEGISWGVPFYKYHGDFAGFATYKKHVSFGIATGVLESKDREMLKNNGYVTGIKTIQIKFDQKVPTAVIKQILKAKVRVNEATKGMK
ncbi:MAG: DUF1801 domain-containing protein [Saprospiraceae bacterium]